MEPMLQIALDLVDLDDALRIADEAVTTGFVDWIEVGTPLIKSEGLRAVKKVKESFPDNRIIADMDVIGHPLELKAAIDTGADAILVSGMASEEIIKKCVEEGRKKGVDVMVDITTTPSPADKAKRLEDMDVDYLLVNFDDLGNISDSVDIPLAVAIDSDIKKAGDAVALGAGVIIISEAITKTTNVPNLVGNIKKAMTRKPTTSKTAPKTSIDEDYLESITEGLENVKDILIKLEAQRRADEEHKIQMKDEMDRMEERFKRMLEMERGRIEEDRRIIQGERDRIKEGWARLKEAEVKLEEKQRKLDREHRERREEMLEDLTEDSEKREKIVEEDKEIEGMLERKEIIESELGEVEKEWKDIEGVWNRVDEDKREIKEKREEIDSEWRKIENIKKEIEKDQGMIKKQMEEMEEMKKTGISNLPKLVSRVSEIKKKQEDELKKIDEERENIEERQKHVEAAEKRIEEEGERIKKEFRKLEEELNKIKTSKGEEKAVKDRLEKVGVDLQKLKEEHDKIKEPVKKEEIADENIKMMINNLIDLVDESGEIKLKDAAKELAVSEYLVRRWGKLLDKRKVIEMKTPLLGDVILRRGRNMDRLGGA